MYLVYYDEVKYDPPNQESYWYGGVAIHSENIPEIEGRINAIAEDYFGHSKLCKETEIHAIDVFQGKGLFKGQALDQRLALMESMIEIASRSDVFGIYSKINAGRLRYGMDPQETAFTLFVEKVDGFLRGRSSLGMLFGDYDQPLVGLSVATLSQFRKYGTKWALGREIKNLIDTIHFAQSHHSRLIQLADVYLYCQQFRRSKNESAARKKLLSVIQKYDGLHPTTFREYPQMY